MRGARLERHAAEEHATLVGDLETAQAVEERGLAGAVGADEPDDLVLAEGEAHLLERGHAAEGDAHRSRLEQAHRAGSPSSALKASRPRGWMMPGTPATPSGRNRITPMSTSP